MIDISLYHILLRKDVNGCVLLHHSTLPKLILNFCCANTRASRSLCRLLPLSESDDQNYRVCAVHALVHKLPDRNREMLQLLVRHLVTYVLPSPSAKLAAFTSSMTDKSCRGWWNCLSFFNTADEIHSTTWKHQKRLLSPSGQNTIHPLLSLMWRIYCEYS